MQDLTSILGDLQVVYIAVGDDIDCHTQETAEQERRVLLHIQLHKAPLVQAFGNSISLRKFDAATFGISQTTHDLSLGFHTECLSQCSSLLLATPSSSLFHARTAACSCRSTCLRQPLACDKNEDMQTMPALQQTLRL